MKLSDKAYDVMKWIGLIACPAVAVFIKAVGPVWGWPYVDEIVLTINSAGVLIGALLGVSSANYYKDGDDTSGKAEGTTAE